MPTSLDDDRARAMADEERRARILRFVVDLTTSVLHQGRLTRAEAKEIVAAARGRVLELFPDKEHACELILAPRFARLLREFAPAAVSRRKVLPFRKAPD